jgi:hypothetical protein
LQAKRKMEENDLIIDQGLDKMINNTELWKKKIQMMG